jgi:DNA-binding transcriptional ArsR family regulator
MNDSTRAFISMSIEMELDLTTVLHALGDPVRLQIVRELADREPRACGTFRHLGVAPSTLSHHFRVLREAGLLETSIEGKKRMNSLRREAVEGRFPGLLDSVLRAAPLR